MEREKLWEELVKNYKEEHRKSEQLFHKACEYQVRGGSHNLRLFPPFPFYVEECTGSKIKDRDGRTYVDFWQGHFANVLGHNPAPVIKALQGYFQRGQGLAAGFPDELQVDLAELLLSQIKADKIRFITSGTLATMYAVMLAKAFTNKKMVLKAGGGWHGAHPYVLKGIFSYNQGFNQLESAGLPPGMEEMIIVTRFNDIQDLEEKFKEFGDHIACFIIEPFMGAGGFIFAHRDYLQKARSLTRQFGSLLVFDEVVSGFRFHSGCVQTLYQVHPDLTVMGKAIGGGMPVSAVAGREEIMALCGPEASVHNKVKFEGGTFSGQPACMLAGLEFIKYLISHQSEIYPRIGKLGEKVRKSIEEIFTAHGFRVKCTGYGDGIAQHSSLIGVQFLHAEADRITSPEQVWNPQVCDIEMREKLFKLAMLKEGFNIFHGYGSISAAHTEDEIQASLDAVERVAKGWRKHNIPKK